MPKTTGKNKSGGLMFINIMIVLVFLWEFLSFLFISDRMRAFDSLSRKDDISEYTDSEKRVLKNVGIKSIFVMVYTFFLIYGLFVPEVFIYCLLTIILSIITGIVSYYGGKHRISLTSRIWLIRIDAILTMLIWLSPLLKVIGSIQ